jgi:hypothetical protein
MKVPNAKAKAVTALLVPASAEAGAPMVAASLTDLAQTWWR